MPVYNTAAFVSEAIESILRQTYEDFEFIIVDDGSTDATPRILRAYAERDTRIRIVPSTHGGISTATNRGLSLARAAWIAIMHADDVALPTRLERQMQAAVVHPDVVAWGTHAFLINAGGKRLGYSGVGPTSHTEFQRMRARSGISLLLHSSTMFKREVVLAAGGYDPSWYTCEDFDLLDRMMDHGPILAIPEPLQLRRIHSQSNTVRTFFQMRLRTRYVERRRKVQDATGDHLHFEDFLDQHHAQPLAVRLREQLMNHSQYHYHKAGIYFGENRWLKTGLHLATALVANPRFVLRRVSEQQGNLRKHRLKAMQPSASSVKP